MMNPILPVTPVVDHLGAYASRSSKVQPRHFPCLLNRSQSLPDALLALPLFVRSLMHYLEPAQPGLGSPQVMSRHQFLVALNPWFLWGPAGRSSDPHALSPPIEVRMNAIEWCVRDSVPITPLPVTRAKPG